MRVIRLARHMYQAAAMSCSPMSSLLCNVTAEPGVASSTLPLLLKFDVQISPMPVDAALGPVLGSTPHDCDLSPCVALDGLPQSERTFFGFGDERLSLLR